MAQTDRIRIVIVGAGHAGVAAATLFGQRAPNCDVVLVGEEGHLPYHRPPLSKAYLKEGADSTRILLKGESFYAANRIELKLGERIVGIDRETKQIIVAAGAPIKYDALILATGSEPRRLNVPGAKLNGIYELRDIADADKIRSALGKSRRLVVVGGGYIGLEVAASARAAGLGVTVVERESRILARVAGTVLSQRVAEYHCSNGVEIITDTQVVVFDATTDGDVGAVRLSTGATLECDMVLVGVGGVPRDELARDANLSCGDGVIVDHRARTSDPSIYAIGDVSARPVPLYGRTLRLESVQNATEQAKQVVADITGQAAPKAEIPWFWSDQYDLKIQIAGLPLDADSYVVRIGAGSQQLAVFHLLGERLRAVEAINSPAEYMAGRALIESGGRLSKQKLADATVAMSNVLADL
ncbi:MULTISPECIES: NAD(P)/FAD-dependent oxidoreductase [Caballeronia]|uniref:Ferredoxin reductase n=1 Tax=Caballeronia zhejiangensis TaxID=871203 RepID=A0A656QE32_9BURK|nr:MULTISPECIES: FAD-dependent oxidoreductase [Caballeronia]EKS71816.1 phenylpropionate dioxygenase ferredoxin reductase subunit [Burkholderia sp. SJ98]KDR25325.1 ferredoxin reductase [Caballeronia zhejiangensis]